MASLSPLSLPSPSPLPFPRTSSDLSSPSPHLTTPPSPNIYVTYKVLQLLDTFRERIQTRVRSNRILKKETSTRVTRDFCQDLEREAFQEIDRYLGRRTTARSRKQSYPVLKSELANESKRKPRQAERSTVATTVGQHRNPSASSIEWLLNELNRSVESESNTLVAVAKDNDLFLKRKTVFHIEHLSVKELTQLLVVVIDLLGTLRRTVPSRSGVKTLAEGNELLDLTLDENVIANFEHLLHCLKDQLILLLLLKSFDLVRKHLEECQRDQHRHCEDWFFEFPDSRHPLSTTWPWSIRPSLAVIWGVCWMFVDPINPSWEELLSKLTPAQLEHMLSSAQQPILQGFYHHPPGTSRSVPFGRRVAHGPAVGLANFSPHSLASSAQMSQPQDQRTGQSAVANFSHNFSYSSAHDHQAAITSANTGTSTTTAPPGAYATDSTSANQAVLQHFGWLPELPEVPQSSHLLGSNTYQDSTQGAEDFASWDLQSTQNQQFGVEDSWQQSQQFHPVPPHQNLPPHTHTRPQTPQAPGRLNTSNLSPWPQDHQPASATSISSVSTQPLQSSPYNNTRFGQNLSPLDALNPHYPMNHQPDEKMQHTPPVSPHAVEVAQMGEQLSRKRSYDQMAAGSMQYPPVEPNVDPNIENRSRAGSTSSQAREYSPPLRNIAVKRGDPPTNPQGKFVCEFLPECSELTFDRKCEWSKHMDKHDRPYRCQRKECEKLQGFTYSGGLLRHEREVHNKHGGPKSKLVCPHEDCKRHNGKGFTRKENLNEHLRRVHENKETPSQSQGPSQIKRDVENVETPYYTQLDESDSPMHKRSRPNHEMSERGASEGMDDHHLRQEIEHLRADNQAKEVTIDRLREDMDQLNATVRLLQDHLQSLQGPMQAQAQV